MHDQRAYDEIYGAGSYSATTAGNYAGYPLGHELPAALRSAVGDELDNNERLLWTGQPDPGPQARSAIPAVLFGIPWTLFSLFWVIMAATAMNHSNLGPLGWGFPLFGVPFVLAGFGMLSSPYWAARAAKNTAYAVTDRRVLTVTLKGKGRRVEQWVPQNVADLERTEKANGSGNLTLVKHWTKDGDGDACVNMVRFTGIPDVRRVERLIRETFFARPVPLPAPHVYTDPNAAAPLYENVGVNAPWWTTRR